MTTNTTTGHRLQIRRMLPAPQPRVWAAWTDVEENKQWGGPEGTSVGSFTADFRVGGAYRLTIRKENGEEWPVTGVYKAIDPPQKLVYTWTWEEDDKTQEQETLVTVEFLDRGKETELVLTHENLASAESAENHRGGWNSMAGKFAGYLAAHP